MGNRLREAGRGSLARRVAGMIAPVFRAKDPAVVRAMYHVAIDMPGQCRPKAAAIMEEAEPLTCDQDEGWSEPRYLAEDKMADPCKDRPAPAPVSVEERAQATVIARKAIDASLELADRPAAA